MKTQQSKIELNIENPSTEFQYMPEPKLMKQLINHWNLEYNYL